MYPDGVDSETFGDIDLSNIAKGMEKNRDGVGMALELEAYEQYNYCRNCHDNLMKEAWDRVRSSGSKNDDHIAPTAV